MGVRLGVVVLTVGARNREQSALADSVAVREGPVLSAVADGQGAKAAESSSRPATGRVAAASMNGTG